MAFIAHCKYMYVYVTLTQICMYEASLSTVVLSLFLPSNFFSTNKKLFHKNYQTFFLFYFRFFSRLANRQLQRHLSNCITSL